MVRAGQTKREQMLLDKDVQRWHDNLCRGSPITAEVNLRRLGLFCEQNQVTARELVELGKDNRKALEDLIQDHVTRMEKDGKAPSYTAGVLKAIKSWLSHNEVEIKRKIKISNSNATPTIEDERVPEKDELKTLLMYGKERSRVCIALVSQAGLRLETLGNESGTDGLKISDLPELEVTNNRVEFNRIPAMIAVRSTLSKARHKYFTFLTNEGGEYLRVYLEKRMALGEIITSDSPIIAVTPGFEKMGRSSRNRDSSFLCTRNVSREIRETMRPKFKWRPYVLRAYFDTQMLLAESHGKLTHPYRVFFMGHKGDMEARYTTNKGRLPEELIEDMRKSFERCQEYLQTQKPVETSEEKLRESFRKQLLILAGYSQEEVEKKNIAEISDEELQDIVRKRLLGTIADDSRKQKVVKINEVETYLSQGWEYVANLPNERIIIKQ